MQNVKHAIITCAGYGSRLGLNMPKCLVKVGDRTLLSYLLEILEGIEDIRIVVGFMEELVIQEAKTINQDVVIVRNPDYKTTTNSYSVHLATKDIKDPFIMIDGDMIIDRLNFQLFLASIDQSKDIIGICESKTEDAVFVNLNNDNQILSFQRHPVTQHEWCGIAYLKNIKISSHGKFVFNEIEPFLPLHTFKFNCFEIDTPEDLEVMKKGFHTLGY